MGEKCEATPFDRLPDELIIKIFGYLIKDEGDMSSLRQTCKRFCQIINSTLLTHPDFIEYGWDDLPQCKQCVKIFAVSNLKFAKCNTIFMSRQLELCCFNTLKTLKSRLNTITGLLLRGIFDLTLISKLLAILGNVHHLRLHDWCGSVVDSIQTTKRFNRTLSSLEVVGLYFDKQLDDLLDFPSRDIRVRNLNNYNVSWFKRYLFRHQQIVNHAEVIIDICLENYSPFMEELSEAIKSAGFNVKARQNSKGSIELEVFKSTSM
jgi:hypothetical protein